MLAKGDFERRAVWLRILKAVNVSLDMRTPDDSATLH